MNLLVAISLFYLDEESAFWCLVAIVEKILPADYYTHGLLSSQADQVSKLCAIRVCHCPIRSVIAQYVSVIVQYVSVITQYIEPVCASSSAPPVSLSLHTLPACRQCSRASWRRSCLAFQGTWPNMALMSRLSLSTGFSPSFQTLCPQRFGCSTYTCYNSAPFHLSGTGICETGGCLCD